MRNMEQAGPQADQADKDQINRDDVVEDARYKKDQYACDQRDQRLDYENVKCHRQIPGGDRLWEKILPAAACAARYATALPPCPSRRNTAIAGCANARMARR